MNRRRSTLFRILPVLAAALLAAGCAPASQLPGVDPELAEIEAEKQRELVLEERFGFKKKLHRVAYPILMHSAELCGDTTHYRAGFDAVNINYFSTEFRKAARSVFNFDKSWRVISVAPGSAADRAGLKKGDIFVGVGEWSMTEHRGVWDDAVEKIEEYAEEQDSAVVHIVRGGENFSLTLQPDKVCDYGFSVGTDSIVNAFADGENTVYEIGMMKFAQKDEELAVVVGHEFAHNLMGHISKGKINTTIGSVFDLLIQGATGIGTGGLFAEIGNAAYSQGFEAEADYVGLYMTARAGIDVSDAPNFWRRMGVNHPGSIKSNHASSHPASPERFVALEKTVEEINGKRARNEPLIPNEAPTPEPQPSKPGDKN